MGWVFRSNTMPRGGLWRSLLLATPMLGGCASQPVGSLAPAMTPPGIEFSVEQRPYSLGDTIRRVLSNESDQSGIIQLCAIVMERENAEGWERVPTRPPNPSGLPVTCPDMGIALPPGRSFITPYPVIREMGVGVFRFRGDLVWREIETVLITNEFRVSG